MRFHLRAALAALLLMGFVCAPVRAEQGAQQPSAVVTSALSRVASLIEPPPGAAAQTFTQVQVDIIRHLASPRSKCPAVGQMVQLAAKQAPSSRFRRSSARGRLGIA